MRTARPSPAQRVRSCDAPTWPNAGAARDGEACVPRLFCKNGPDLQTNHPETHGTIPTVSYFADKPSEQPVFATMKPSGTRARTNAAALAPGGYAGQTSPSPSPNASRCSPRRKPEAIGGEAMNGDAVPSSLHDGGLLPATAAMFP